MTFFDYFSPMLQIAQEIGGMKTVELHVPGKTGREVCRELNRQGIRTGVAMMVNGVLLVPVSDPDRAEKIASRM